MTHVLIVVGEADEPMPFAPADLEQVTGVLEQAIASTKPERVVLDGLEAELHAVKVQGMTVDTALAAIANSTPKDLILYPLTLNLPECLASLLPDSRRTIYQTCQDSTTLRQWVRQDLDDAIGSGAFWLPIVLTAKGPLYAEVIGRSGASATVEESGCGSPLRPYHQPVHLSDRWRQPLYRLGQRLLRSISAPPAVYLLQFGFQDQQICFDRLLPFPAAPAIASIGVQMPDLFTCHWRCLTQQPILDVVIDSRTAYQLHDPDA